MAKYRKKPVTIDAEIYKEGMEDGFDIVAPTGIFQDMIEWTYSELTSMLKVPYINTLEGKHYIRKGDYIITGIKGEKYPCKPDIFHKTYQKVGE